MRTRNISHIILEGVDGVGKTSMIYPLLKKLDYKYSIYDRGELSNYIYSKRYGRKFETIQIGLPFLFVILTCDRKELEKRIRSRGGSEDFIKEELKKIKDQHEFKKLVNGFSNDYHIIEVDTTGLTLDESVELVADNIIKYINSLSYDNELTYNSFNRLYSEAAKLLNWDFEVRGFQPYLNGEKIMTDTQYNVGKFETFTDKSYPVNLLYSLGYPTEIEVIDFEQRDVDFVYPVNSRVLLRPEVYEYINVFVVEGKKVLTTDTDLMHKHDNILRFGKVYGVDYIKTLSRAKATVYTGREVEYLKMQTGRLYESILAKQLVFVDKYSDLDGDMLKLIFPNDKEIREILTVTPDTIVRNYNIITSNKEMYEYILETQSKWYFELRENLLRRRIDDK